MENLNQQGEQPKMLEDENNLVNQIQKEDLTYSGSQINNAEKVGENSDSVNQSGSPYGKFKTAQDLLTAYNNLQAEFTKKCQKLSELTKSNGEVCNGNSESSSNKTTTLNPQFDAKEGIKELAKSLASSLNATVSNNARAEDLNNGDFKILSDFILSNPSLRTKVLKGCIEDVQASSAPILISSGKGTTSLNKPQKAHSVSEAGKLALNMFGTTN